MNARVSFRQEGKGEGKSSSRGRGRRHEPSIVPATAGDHTAIHQLLVCVFQEPSRHEFRASLDDPHYEPRDRLLLKHRGRVVGHALVTHRVMRFGQACIPVSGLHWLSLLPEYRLKGYGRELLAAAESRMASEGALVGLARTRIPFFFRPAGWALCGRHSCAQGDPRAVLAALADGRRPHGARRKRVTIRPWRRLELRSLVRIYEHQSDGAYGPFERSPTYWQWLLARQAFDQLYVALDGPDLMEIEERNSPIVGYAFTRAEHVVELAALPGSHAAAKELLARCCGDAIERGCQSIRWCAAPDAPLTAAFCAAGGTHQLAEAAWGEVLMARVLNPVALLERMEPEWLRRVEEAGLRLPLELGLAVDGIKLRVRLSARRVQAACGALGRSYLTLNVADFTRLVLGQLDWSRAAAAGRLRASTQTAAEIGRALFPQVPYFRPMLDELYAPEQPIG